MISVVRIFIFSLIGSHLAHAQQGMESFHKVRPVLEQNCVKCHGAEEQKGGLRLDTRDGLIAGGDDEDAINTSDLAESYLLKVIQHPKGHDDIMPPEKDAAPMSAEEKEILKQWILAKAPYPSGTTLLAKKKFPPLPVLLNGLNKLSVYPQTVQLDSRDDSHCVVTYGEYTDATTRDLTPAMEYEIEKNDIIQIKGNKLIPIKDGASNVTVKIGDKVQTIKVTVKNAQKSEPITFQRDVMPVLTALGCNTGSCHGSARGQDGFNLSLFGFDPKGDHYRLTRELIGRRINLAIPEESLILTKAAGQVPHTGGKLAAVGSESYDTLLQWVRNGATFDDDDSKLPIAIEVEPKQLVIKGSGQTAQLTVRAKYPDGSDRDVTHLSTFSTSNDSAILVDPKTGLLTSSQRGEAFIMARFHTFTEGMQTIVIPEKMEYKKPQVVANNYIDKLVHNKLHKLRIIPSGLSTDEVFLRRVYIDLIGTLPTAEERQKFLTDESAGKRGKLVDRLVERPEFTDMWVMKWAELLQIRTFQNQVSYKSTILYHNWLQKQFAQRKPFNEIVKDILKARGGNFDQPATNFYQIETDTKKLTENVAQVFMGTRIQCAQCHNHPFDRWTMDDYYSFASFFTQVKRKPGKDPREYIIFDGNGEIKNPVSNQDATPKFLGGEVPELKGKVRRELVANWLTTEENPWFAKNVSNIVWDHFFGVGIIHPVDDVRISNPASNPELLDALAEQFKRKKFSIKELAKDICKSRTYQLESKVNETNKTDSRNFSHAGIRRVRAEVLLDSIAQVTQTPNKFKGLPRGAKATKIADGNTSTYFLSTFGRSTRQSVCSCEVKLEPNLSQALHLLNGDSVHKRIEQGKRIENLIKEKKTDTEIIKTIYLVALTREPTAKENAKLLSYFKDVKDAKVRTQVHQDIFWAVLNSKEYIFNH